MRSKAPNSEKRFESRSRSSRAGFTLLEIVIVATLLVAIGALAVPSMSNFFISQKLKKGADQVRANMATARVRAIRTGEIYAFMFRPGMTSYTVVPFNSAFQESNATQAEEQGGVDNRTSNFSFDLDRLPQGTFFAGGNTTNDPRGAQAFADSEVSVSQLQPVLFYPDGSSQNAVIILENERGHTISVTVRGLTGQTNSEVVVAQ